nr:PaaX family transcriptional regulator C-terminal domain-containing protein [Shewanella corallii]
MLVTLFGDVISQHGHWIWLGSLIEAMAKLGFSERLVRTSVFRLVKNDWLTTKKVGRRSYYALSDSARLHHEKAAKRIYATQFPQVNTWTLLMPVAVPEGKKEPLKKQLQWLGFSLLASGVYAHIEVDKQSLDETLMELGLRGAVIVWSCKVDGPYSREVLLNTVTESWQLAEVANNYQELLDAYRPILRKVSSGEMPDNETCFLLRVLLIHEYRRVVLNDKPLPEDMLPSGWEGAEAKELAGKLYSELALPSLAYIKDSLENAQGYLPHVSEGFWQRFYLSKDIAQP